MNTSSLIPLFDIDWTLLVGKNQVHLDAFTHMFTTVYGEPTAAISDITPHGMIDTQIIVEVMKVHGWVEVDIRQKLPDAFNAINSYYIKNADPKYIEKLPGVDNLLAKLKESDVLMGLLSGNIEGMAWNKMEMADTRPELVSVAQNQIKAKYNIEIPKEQFVIIGDSPLDIITAKKTGTKCIAVATGSSDKARLLAENPELTVSTLEVLDKILPFIINS